MSQPAARQGDPHQCPLCDGNKPHVGGKLTGGVPKVLIGGVPAVAVGDPCRCQSPVVNAVASGSAKVMIANRPAGRQGDSTAHGGTITSGCGVVRLG